MRIPTFHLALLGVLCGMILAGCGNSPPKPSTSDTGVQKPKAPKTAAAANGQDAKKEPAKEPTTTEAKTPAKQAGSEKTTDAKPVAQAPQTTPPAEDAPKGRSRLALPTGDESTSFLVVEAVAPRRNQKDQPYEYEINVRNISDKSKRNVALANLRITQQVPSSMTIKDADVAIQTTDGNKPKGRRTQRTLPGDTGEAGQAVFSINLLEPGESAVIKVTAHGGQRGALVNYLSVQYDPLLRLETEITEPELHITRKGPAVVENSLKIKLAYHLRNDGNQAVKDLVVSEKLPKGVKTADGKDSILLKVGELAGRDQKDYDVDLVAADVGTYQFEPAVAAGADGLKVTSESLMTSVRQGKLQVEAKASHAAQFTGQKLMYTVTVMNIGDAKIDVPQLAANLGKGALLASVTPAAAAANQWKLEALPPGKSSPPLTIAVRSNSPGALESAFEASFECDGQVKKDAQTVRTEIKPLGLDVTVASSDAQVKPDDVFTCLVRLRNQGASPDGDVKLTLSLPEFVTFDGFVDGEGSGTYDAKTRRVSIAPVKQLEPGDKKTWRIRAKAAKHGQGVFAAQATSKALGDSTVEFESDQVVAKSAPKAATPKSAEKPPAEKKPAEKAKEKS
jgi:hypothetical protein